jgi:CRP/FNR family transcriptional regulator, anaerobic regulatory protein
MEQLIQFLNSIYPLSEPLKEYLLLNLQHREVKRKDFLLKAGHVSHNIYFIEKGLFRCFYMQGNNEVCSWFMKEGDVITSIESFFDQKESYESIQALEEGTVYYISYQQLKFIYKNFIEFNYVGRELLQKYYKLSEQRLYSLRMQRGLERYEYLKENHPILLQRVEQKFLASYLGITEQYLSIIKGNGSKKKKPIS